MWAYAAQLLNIGANVLLLPFVLRYLSAPELGLWYVFIALSAGAQLLEFGFQPTIARHASYVYSGAREILAVGVPANERSGNVDLPLLAALLDAARQIYRYVACGAAVCLWGLGSAYILSLAADAEKSLAGLILPWLVFSAGALINFYYGYYNGLLQGRGDLTAANQVVVLSRGTFVLASVPLLVLGSGLTGLACASVLSAIAGRVMSVRAFFRDSSPETAYLRQCQGKTPQLAGTLWRSAWRLGLTQLGAFLVLRANVFVATSFMGLAAAASYGLSVQLLGVVSGLSLMLVSLQAPRMSALQVSGDNAALRRIFCTSVAVALGIFLVGGILLVTCGQFLLTMLGSNTGLLPPPWLLLLTLVMLLEVNHSVSAIYLTTRNSVPFAAAAILSGAGIVSLSIFLVRNTDLGVGGLVVAQGLVQLAYNNWKWPLEAARDLRCGVAECVRLGWAGIRGVFSAR